MTTEIWGILWKNDYEGEKNKITQSWKKLI